MNPRVLLAGTIGLLLLLTAVMLFFGRAGEKADLQLATSTFTPEPIVPTRTIRPVDETLRESAALSTVPSTITPTSAPQSSPTAIPKPQSTSPRSTEAILPADELDRFGIAGGALNAVLARDSGLPFGPLLSWSVAANVPAAARPFWQMVRLEEAGIRRTTWDYIERALVEYPGSFWLIGNEPDVKWQDNVTPRRYADLYHDLYAFIKERDPSSRVVIGGVSQPTPLRRAYLDIVLDTYLENYGEPMPVDVWNVHAFTLREEAGSWGVDIPPGMDGAEGILYEIEDHDNLQILEQNLVDFRAWMAERGYGDHPLVVSEYGILMPADYGFPPERVGAFLTGSFELFRTAANETGYLPDNRRLVQWWFWYSLYDGELYPTGNLWDKDRQELTALGQVWREYVDTAVTP